MSHTTRRDDKIPLGDDAYWGGVPRGIRGRGAKGKRPFVAAVSMNDDGHPMRMRFSAVDGFKKAELTRWAKAHFRPKSLVISDGLACFRHRRWCRLCRVILFYD